MSVVAPAGGWGTRSQIIARAVRASEAEADPTQPSVTPPLSAGAACCSPKATSAAYPATIPTRCPRIALRGQAAGDVG